MNVSGKEFKSKLDQAAYEDEQPAIELDVEIDDDDEIEQAMKIATETDIVDFAGRFSLNVKCLFVFQLLLQFSLDTGNSSIRSYSAKTQVGCCWSNFDYHSIFQVWSVCTAYYHRRSITMPSRVNLKMMNRGPHSQVSI